MSVSECQIFRKYVCYNEDCEAEFVQDCIVNDPWIDRCPCCTQKTVYLDKASLTMSTFVDSKNGKTLGSISEQNKKRWEQEGDPRGIPEKKSKPFWRKSEKVNLSILKNPKKYIETGQI